MIVMPSLQIRELPEDIYEALAYRAKRSGRSLAQQAVVELRKMTLLGAHDRRLAVLDEIERRPKPTNTEDWPDPVDLIRHDRDRDHEE